MGVEVVGFEVVQTPVENGTERGVLDEGAKLNEPIKFGSHGDEPAKGEGNNASVTNLPKDAVDEWPAPKQIHSFYFVRYRTYDDPKIKAKIDYAEKEIQKRNQARSQLTEALRAKRSEKAEVNSHLQSLFAEDKQFRAVIDGKRKEMEPLQQALGKLRNTNSASRGGICSSEEELNDYIRSLHYRMQHESIPLTEEKQILREIKQLEGTREKVIANSAVRTQIQDSMGQKDAIQDQVKLIGGDLDGVRKEHQSLRAKIKCLEDERKAIEDDIKSLQDQLNVVIEKRDEAYGTVQELRKQRDDGNARFYQSRSLLNKAKELAAKRDITALEELQHAEVEKFMSLWCDSKDFRNDYEKRILSSLDSRQLSRDGRMRNPGEKPLVVLEAPTPSKPETLGKANVKQPKEDSKSSTKKDALPIPKVHKEANKKSADLGTTLKHEDIAHKEVNVPEKLHKDSPPVVKEIDKEKLKEMKREEEIAKAKMAIERKKKLAEKAAAKAAARAQKEAEKKIKEREKKEAKKVASASATATDPEESAETVEEAAESENLNAEVSVSTRAKVQKKNSVRYKGRPKGPESRPKVIIKRKKSTNYWAWAAPVGLVLALIFLALGYHYYI